MITITNEEIGAIGTWDAPWGADATHYELRLHVHEERVWEDALALLGEVAAEDTKRGARARSILGAASAATLLTKTFTISRSEVMASPVSPKLEIAARVDGALRDLLGEVAKRWVGRLIDGPRDPRGPS